MQNEKLSHREVEVSRNSNQTKAKIVTCQHPEVPFQRDFPVFFRSFFLSFNWLYWVFVAAPGLSRVAASRGGQLFVAVCRLLIATSNKRWLLLLYSMGSRCVGAVVVYKSFHLLTPTSHSIHFPNPLIKCIYLWEIKCYFIMSNNKIYCCVSEDELENVLGQRGGFHVIKY